MIGDRHIIANQVKVLRLLQERQGVMPLFIDSDTGMDRLIAMCAVPADKEKLKTAFLDRRRAALPHPVEEYHVTEAAGGAHTSPLRTKSKPTNSLRFTQSFFTDVRTALWH